MDDIHVLKFSKNTKNVGNKDLPVLIKLVIYYMKLNR